MYNTSEDYLFGTRIATYFSAYHSKDVNGAKFKIGEIVKFKGETYEVTGVNCLEENVYEYSLAELPFLYYEEELEKI